MSTDAGDDLGPGWAMRKMNEYAIANLRARPDPAGQVADEAYAAGYRDGCAEALRGVADADESDAEAVAARFDGFFMHVPTDPLCSQHREPTTGAQRDRFDSARGIVCRACAAAAAAAEQAWADGYNHAKVEMLSTSIGDRAECVTCSGRGVWMDEPCGECQGSAPA